MKKVSKEYLIDQIKNQTSDIQHPELIKLLSHKQIRINFFIKCGDELFVDFNKIKNMCDSDIFEMLPNDELSNMALNTFYNKVVNEKNNEKKYNMIPIDIVNKSLVKMINHNIALEKISYAIMIDEDRSNMKFSYSHLIVLRAIYNLYYNGINSFTANDVFYQIYDCHGVNINISIKAKKEIISIIEDMSAIKIKLNYETYSIMIDDFLLPATIENGDKTITYTLLKEPCLLKLSKDIMQYLPIPSKTEYNNQRKLIDITIFTCIFDFVYGFKRSNRPTMRFNLSTIFEMCDIVITSRNRKHDLTKKIVSYLEYFKGSNILDFYKIKNYTIYVYKKVERKASMTKTLIKLLPTIEEIIEKRELLETEVEPPDDF